jgi:hypothetical protein
MYDAASARSIGRTSCSRPGRGANSNLDTPCGMKQVSAGCTLVMSGTRDSGKEDLWRQLGEVTFLRWR